jgi:hypothetical protein
MIRRTGARDDMKAIVCLILSSLIQPLAGQAQAFSLSKDQWKNDVSYLMATIDSIHPSPYAKHPKAMFDKAADELSRDIPGLTDSQIAARMMRIVALLGDGHSHLVRRQAVSDSRADFLSYGFRLS